MKILACPDLHLTDKTPVNRIDDYPKTQYDKVCRILNFDSDVVVLPGDVFDSYKVSHNVVQQYAELFSLLRKSIYVVYGQHDMHYHSLNTDNSPLKVLESAELVCRLTEEPQPVGNNVFLYGASFGEAVPKPVNKKATNILVIHKMVVNTKLWEAQEDFIYSEELLKYGFDCIISGDNHERFMWKDKKDRLLVNCGSLMRSSRDQIKHKPSVCLIDTEKGFSGFTELKIKPAENVFDLQKIEEEVAHSKEIEAFVEGLKADTDLNGLDFVSNLKSFCKRNKVGKEITTFIEKCLESL